MDVEEITDYIWSSSPGAAKRWQTGFWQVVKDLKRMPAKYALIPEAEDIGVPYRDVLHHSHRVVYRIEEEAAVIYIVRVYHGARRPLTKRDLE